MVDLKALRSARGVEAAGNGPAQSVDLTALETVGDRGLFVSDVDVDVLGLQSLTNVGGEFLIVHAWSIPEELPALTTIGGTLYAAPLPGDLSPFVALTSVGTLSNESVDGPTTFAGLRPDIAIGTLTVRNSRMTRIEGIPAPSGSLDVRDNAQLDVVDLTHTTVGVSNNVAITGNATLDAVRLDVPTLGGTLTLSGNGALGAVELAGFTTLSTALIDAASLTSLEACDLSSVQSLTLRNTDLTTLDGLAALGSCSTLSVTNNTSLPACLVDALGAQSAASALTNTGNSATAPDPCTIDATAVCGG
ncbi:MAG: hypothetical protein IT382_24055 [Deltaproteobacteria bacterium]|nr:hypothetical protein [Deltaproteobacteria bacterium]